MTFFPYRNGRLHIEDVSLDELAARVGTPFFCYSAAAMESAYTSFVRALGDLPATVCYALKANSNQAVIRTFAQLGAGADVVSEGELRRALAAGVPASKVVFAGVGKQPSEMATALDAGILQFNVESLPELEALSRIAQEKGVRAPVALRINPDVDALTHAKISTGKAENKFGIDIPSLRGFLDSAAQLPGVRIEGLAVHIGSQITDVNPYRMAFERLVALFTELRDAGWPLERLDMGGGLGIAYEGDAAPDIARYAEIVRETTKGLDAKLIFEPGRFLTGNAGLLVTRTVYVKHGTARRFAIVDAAMNDLIRPTLYDAWHDILPVAQFAAGADREPYDIVGPICESSDIFAEQRELPPVAADDLLAICSSGAYGAVMSSSYNSRPPAPEILVRGNDYAVIRPRIDYDELIGQDRLPDWLDDGQQSSEPRGAA
ncbi:diaminopimelate decarboxylase [Pelagibius sp. Alg239-R121]|uniref:diaminopimelate decarboxylase n=1 Tax=Pelagibius sp. Alg239-R121 TaxID=2993448 RepID=UPI0024A72690|nr:diaminopimelate decarboxylase [Pelagibius sp. Alg239-R121]